MQQQRIEWANMGYARLKHNTMKASGVRIYCHIQPREKQSEREREREITAMCAHKFSWNRNCTCSLNHSEDKGINKFSFMSPPSCRPFTFTRSFVLIKSVWQKWKWMKIMTYACVCVWAHTATFDIIIFNFLFDAPFFRSSPSLPWHFLWALFFFVRFSFWR